MKTLYLSLIAILSVTSFTIAQPRMIIKGGGAHSNWRGSGMDLFSSLVDVAGSDFIRQQGLNSFYVGAGVEFPVTDKFRVETGLQYARVGASIQGNLAFKALELLGIRAGANAVAQRLEVPVLAKFEVVPGLSIMAGPQVNYTFDNKLRLQASVLGVNLVNQKVSLDNYTEPMSASAVAGLQYAFNDGLNIHGTYEYGLSRIAKNNSANIYQNSIRFGIGVPIGRK